MVKKPLTKEVVLAWLEDVHGKFYLKDAWQEIGIGSTEGKQSLRVICSRLTKDGFLKDVGYGAYIKKDDFAPVQDWRNANENNIVPLKWPFALQDYAAIYPKNVVIVAGQKQEGKSTFLYNFIKLNMHTYQIDLFNSETGSEQMHSRFIELGMADDATFNVFERYDNFADVIKPDRISVIDYLDQPEGEYFKSGIEINQIFKTLTTGIAVIGMQVPPPKVSIYKGQKQVVNRDYAYGGGETAKRAFIYITLTSHKLTLKHVKKPANPQIHPENMTWTYDFNEVGQFTNINRWAGDDCL